MTFWTEDGYIVPAVTAEQMREVDRVAMSEFGLGILQMMENAGRNLAENVRDMLDGATGEVTILAGAGGNGGGGLCCARHLHNRDFKVWVVLDRDAALVKGAAGNQLHILQAADVHPAAPFYMKRTPTAPDCLQSASARSAAAPSNMKGSEAAPSQAQELIKKADIVVDALIGYSLRGAPRGRVAELIELCNQHAARVLSLDVPSGLNATSGEAPGLVVRPERTLTLALPKTGLQHVPGELYLADIGIPPEIFHQLGLSYEPPFGRRYWVRLKGA